MHKCLENLKLSIVRSSLCECVCLSPFFSPFSEASAAKWRRGKSDFESQRGWKDRRGKKKKKKENNEQKQLVCLSHFLPHPQGPLNALLIDFGHSAQKLPNPLNLGFFHYAPSIRSIFPLSPFQYTTDATRRRVTPLPPPPPASVYAETCVTSRLGREKGGRERVRLAASRSIVPQLPKRSRTGKRTGGWGLTEKSDFSLPCWLNCSVEKIDWWCSTIGGGNCCACVPVWKRKNPPVMGWMIRDWPMESVTWSCCSVPLWDYTPRQKMWSIRTSSSSRCRRRMRWKEVKLVLGAAAAVAAARAMPMENGKRKYQSTLHCAKFCKKTKTTVVTVASRAKKILGYFCFSVLWWVTISKWIFSKKWRKAKCQM